MNRWITAVFVLLAACQATPSDSETSDVEQAATTGDCIPGGNYTYAKMPSLPLWNGSKPTAYPGQVILDVPDWRKSTQSTGLGFHVAVLVDPGSGKFLWGATIPDGKLGSFRAYGQNGNQPMVGDCCRPPPCACRGCCDDWLVSTWMARNMLEVALRTVDDADNGAAAAGPLYIKK